MASHCGLQYFFSSPTVQLQLGCAHFLLAATGGSFPSGRRFFYLSQPNFGSFFACANLRAIRRFEEISEELAVARSVTGVFLLAYGFLLMESIAIKPLTSTIRERKT